MFFWGQWRFRLVLLPAETAGRYQKSFTAMTRLLLLFFSSLALIGSGFIQHEHRRHELTLLARRVVALGSVQDFGTVVALAALSHQAFTFTCRQGNSQTDLAITANNFLKPPSSNIIRESIPIA